MSLKQGPLREALDLGRHQARAFLFSVAVLFFAFGTGSFVEAGWVTSSLMIPPCIIILLTAIARVNDIGPDLMGWSWQLRRVGLVLAAAGAVMYSFSPWTVNGEHVPWRALALAYGVAAAWITTPSLPPWWDYITGKYREQPNLKTHVGRFTGAGRTTQEFRIDELKRRMGDGDGP